MKILNIFKIAAFCVFFVWFLTGCGANQGTVGREEGGGVTFTPYPPMPAVSEQLAVSSEHIRGTETLNLSSGWSTISFPADHLISTSGFAYPLQYWDGNAYQQVNPGAGLAAEMCRRGFWAMSNSASAVTINAGDQQGPGSLTLQAGWNLISFPFRSGKNFSELNLTYNGVTRGLAAASSLSADPSAAWFYGIIQYYKNNRWYQLKYDNPNNALQPWKGYWVFSWKNNLVLNFSPPLVSNLSPNFGPSGATITVSGANFGGGQGNSRISFNGTDAQVCSWADHQIACLVPAGAGNGPVVVTVNGVNSNSDKIFTYLLTPSGDWIDYDAGTGVSAIIEDGDFLWVGGGGLCKLNKITGEKTIYNAANSGLPDNLICSMALDINGDLWIATDNGLAKFDRVNHWTQYSTYNSPLPSNGFGSVEIDPEGVKWLAINGELLKFDGVNWTIYDSTDSPIPPEGFGQLIIDTAGNKWLGCGGGVLLKFDGVNWTEYNPQNSGLPENDIWCLAPAPDGSIWIAGNYSICRFANGNCELKGGIYVPRCLAVDAGGNAWVGSYGGYVSKFDGQSWSYYDVRALAGVGYCYNDFGTITIGSGGEIWIGYNAGLVKFADNQWSFYNTGNSGLPDDFATSLAIDPRNDDVWFSTWSFGLAKLSGGQWSDYNYQNSALADYGEPLFLEAVDRSGAIWTDCWNTYGIGRFDPTANTWNFYYSSDFGSPPYGWIDPVAVAPDNSVWMVISPFYNPEQGKLLKYDRGNWTVWNISDSGLQFGSYSLAIAGNGEVWLGGGPAWVENNGEGSYVGGGLVKFDGAHWSIVNLPAALESNSIGSICFDSQDNLVVSVWPESVDDLPVGGGTALLTGNTWTIYDLPFFPDTLMRDSNGRVWGLSNNYDNLGETTLGITRYLLKFEGNAWQAFSLDKPGFPNDRLNKAGIDGSGNFWVSTWGGAGSILLPPGW